MAQNYMNDGSMYPSNLGSMTPSPTFPPTPPQPTQPRDLDFLFATVNSNGNVSVGQNGTPNGARVNSPLMQAPPQSQPQPQSQNSPSIKAYTPHLGYYNNNPALHNSNNSPSPISINPHANTMEFFDPTPTPSTTSSMTSSRSPAIDLDFNPSPPQIQNPPNHQTIPLNNSNNGNTSSNTASNAAPELNVQVLQIGRLIQMLEVITSTSNQVLNRVEGMEGRLTSLETSVKEILTNQRSLNMQLKDTEVPLTLKKSTANSNANNTAANNNNANNVNTASPISTPPPPPLSNPAPYQMGYFPPMMGMPPHPMMPMPGQLVPVTHIKEPGVPVSSSTPGGPGSYDSDLELAKKLQATFDSESPQNQQQQPPQQQHPKPVSRPAPRDLQECPMCALKLPVGELESHVAGHFEEDLANDKVVKKEEPKQQPGFFSKLFSKGEEEKKGATPTPSSNTNPTPNTTSNPSTNNSNANRPASTSVGASSNNTNTYRPPASNTPSYPGSYPRNQYYYQPAPMQQYLYPSPYSPMNDQSHQ
eukprot:TRINITY_DN5804_c0_g1_i1.p1 TRINITY_DN5804_c0_g1~~TRINITY_DN5804_c0_g1_i1.p1  ORF type:complete len:531 (+),score=176.79 TRINITY_DN5804_c0_g1_i1:418-2010(+)